MTEQEIARRGRCEGSAEKGQADTWRNPYDGPVKGCSGTNWGAGPPPPSYESQRAELASYSQVKEAKNRAVSRVFEGVI
jgi:hypothetical protein